MSKDGRYPSGKVEPQRRHPKENPPGKKGRIEVNHPRVKAPAKKK